MGLVGGLALTEDMLVVADTCVRVYDSGGNLQSTFGQIPKGIYIPNNNYGFGFDCVHVQLVAVFFASLCTHC